MSAWICLKCGSADVIYVSESAHRCEECGPLWLARRYLPAATRCQSEHRLVPETGCETWARLWRLAEGWLVMCNPDGPDWRNDFRWPNPCSRTNPGDCTP